MSNYTLPPPPSGSDVNSPEWKKWFFLLQGYLGNLFPQLFSTLDFTGSNLTSLETRNHNDLQNIQGGSVADYYHLTQVQHTDLTDSGDSTLHFHSSDRDLANASGNLSVNRLNNGTGASSTTFWRGDGVWAVPPSGGGGAGLIYEPLVAANFNLTVSYLVPDSYVPDFLTTSDGDIIMGWNEENVA